MPRRLEESHDYNLCLEFNAKTVARICQLIIILESITIGKLMMTKSVYEHYNFYFYLDIIVLASMFIPIYCFYRYLENDTNVRRNCLPIMSIWMIVVTLLILIQTSFLLFKDMSTVITEGRAQKMQKSTSISHESDGYIREI